MNHDMAYMVTHPSLPLKVVTLSAAYEACALHVLVDLPLKVNTTTPVEYTSKAVYMDQ